MIEHDSILDMDIDVYSFQITIKLGIPFIVYGENTNSNFLRIFRLIPSTR